VSDTNAEDTLAAGDFSAWLTQIQGAIRGEHGSGVPCGTCTACCTSSQFIHIEPDEADTLAHIPAELLVPAPRSPHGHVVLGYDDRGHCPMLIEGRCSIYEHRPRTCRTYDCRVFPASGLAPEDPKAAIARQARRWRFTFPATADVTRHRAILAAAASLDGGRGPSQGVPAPASATQRAVRAIEIHEAFLPP
jgi:Fe-S-cluster containining protein